MSTTILPKQSGKYTHSLIFLIMLMDIIGLTILIPVAPFIMQRYSHDALMVTLLSAIYAAAQFIAAPFLGKLSDRVGRRPVLLISMLGSAAGYVIFGIGGALWVLFLSRLIDGITAGNRSTAMAYLIDVTKPEERAQSFALIGMSYGLGFILGPGIGGTLGQISVDAPMFAAAGITLVAVVLIFFTLPESLPKDGRETTPVRLNDLNPFPAIGAMVHRPDLGRLFLVSVLFNLAFDGINSIAGLFVMQKFAAHPWQVGGFFVVAGIATSISQAALTGPFVSRYGEKPMALVGLLGYLCGGMLFVIASTLWMLYPVGFLQTAIGGFIFPTLGALLANRISEHERGQLTGVDSALGGLTAMLGPVWAGVAYEHLTPGAPYWIGTFVLAIALYVLVNVRVQTSRRNPPEFQPLDDR